MRLPPIMPALTATAAGPDGFILPRSGGASNSLACPWVRETHRFIRGC